MEKKKSAAKARRGILRGICLGLVFAIAVISAVFGTGAGTLSSLGVGAVAYLCPLGALEGMLATFSFVPRALIALAVVLVLGLLVGRAFCSWVCPVPPLRNLVATKKMRKAEENEAACAVEVASCNRLSKNASESTPENTPKCSRSVSLDSRHIVLGGSLLTAAVFGFPVFCLVCPIGLTFAIVIGLVRLIGFNEPSVSLLVFAAILLFELVVLRKWCTKICPVSALLSLLGKANRTFRPHADVSKCLRSTQGENCTRCVSACSEHIDPQGDVGIAPISECTRCGKCAQVCPVSAISFPFLAKARKNGK